MIIKSKNIIIKTMKNSYINNNYFNWFNNPDVKKYIKFSPKSLVHLKQNVIRIIKEKNSFFFGIFHNNKHKGNLRIHSINYETNEAWLGILIGDESFRNKGYAKEAINCIKRWLVKKNIFFIKLEVHKSNKPAIKLYKSCNFEVFKRKNISYIMINNNYLSKLVLGSAQFRSKYGVSNIKRKIMNTNEVDNIISFINLKKSEINEIDTAINYKFTTKDLNKIKKPIFLNNKIHTNDNISYQNLKRFFNKKNGYKVNTIYIHDGDNVLSKKGINLLKKLKKLKRAKIINKVGLSIHDISSLKNILNKFSFDVLQIPYSFVDRRAEKYFKIINNKNIEIQVRSIFLQGALLSKIKTNRKLSSIFEKFNYLSKKKHKNRIRYVLSFILKNKYIDKIIVGVRNLKELKQINNLNYLYNNLNKLNVLESKDHEIINPLNWKELTLDDKKTIRSI